MAKFAYCKATAQSVWTTLDAHAVRLVRVARTTPLVSPGRPRSLVSLRWLLKTFCSHRRVARDYLQTVLRKNFSSRAQATERLVNLMAKRSVGTVLTTNLDDLIAPQCARACGPSDTAMKSRLPRLTTRCSIRRPTSRQSCTCTGSVRCLPANKNLNKRNAEDWTKR